MQTETVYAKRQCVILQTTKTDIHRSDQILSDVHVICNLVKSRTRNFKGIIPVNNTVCGTLNPC